MKKKIRVDLYGFVSMIFVIIFCLMAAIRDAEIGTDTSTYIYLFDSISNGGELARDIELGFYWIISIFGWMGNVKFLFFFVPLAIIILSSNLFNTGLGWKFYISCLCFFLSPFFYGHVINILRQGLAFAIIAYMLQSCFDNNKKSVVYILLAGLFHSIGFIFAFLAYISRFIGVRGSIFLWIFGAILGLVISTNSMLINVLMNLVNSDYISGYFSPGSLDYNYGLRLDFLIFSFGLGILGLILIIPRRGASNRILSCDLMRYIVKSYFVMNGFGLIFLQMPYADRWLNWSWALTPLFLIGIFDSIESKSMKSSVLFLASILMPMQILYQLGIVVV